MKTEVELCQRPIFVVGAPRSGTTVLAWALAQHSGLWTSGESYVLWELFGGERGNRGLNLIFQTAEVLAGGSWLTAQSVTRPELLAALGLGVNALFTSRSHPKRWIDHTPVQSLMVETLGGMFPDALFLHALRDGRKVVHSMIHFLEALEPDVRANFEKAGWKIPWLDFTEACRTWRQYVESVEAFAQNNPGRCLTVPHDRLVGDTTECFRAIYEFLGEPAEDAPVEFVRTKRLHSSFQPDREAAPAQEKPASAWTDWSHEQRTIFTREAGPTMIRLGMATAEELQPDSA